MSRMGRPYDDPDRERNAVLLFCVAKPEVSSPDVA